MYHKRNRVKKQWKKNDHDTDLTTIVHLKHSNTSNTCNPFGPSQLYCRVPHPPRPQCLTQKHSRSRTKKSHRRAPLPTTAVTLTIQKQGCKQVGTSRNTCSTAVLRTQLALTVCKSGKTSILQPWHLLSR